MINAEEKKQLLNQLGVVETQGAHYRQTVELWGGGRILPALTATTSTLIKLFFLPFFP